MRGVRTSPGRKVSFKEGSLVMAQSVAELPILAGPKDPVHELSNVLQSILLSTHSMLLDESLPQIYREELQAVLERSRDGKIILDQMREHRLEH